MVIPATWRELGVAAYGQPRFAPGLNWSLGVFNGLNSSEFGNGKGIRGGRFEGREATATNLAVNGALLYYVNDFAFRCLFMQVEVLDFLRGMQIHCI